MRAEARIPERKARPSISSKHSIPMPKHDQADADDAIDDRTPGNVPLRDRDKPEFRAIVMGGVPNRMREVCCGDEPRADPKAEQRGRPEQSRDVELHLLLEVRALDDGKAEIDAGNNAKQHRRKASDISGD